MEAGPTPTPQHEGEPTIAAKAEAPAETDELTATEAAPAAEPPEAAPPSRRRTDQVALALLAGIVVLLLICVIIALVAWRHAPVNPAIPAAHWPLLGRQLG